MSKPGWQDTYERLTAEHRRSPLDPPDIERLAMAAYLTGREGESADLLADAHHAFLAGNETVRAARSAAWLGLMLRSKGDHARSSGWVARARRLLDEGQHDSVERGYVLLPKALDHAGRGEL